MIETKKNDENYIKDNFSWFTLMLINCNISKLINIENININKMFSPDDGKIKNRREKSGKKEATKTK
jgi:hypothetical protein